MTEVIENKSEIFEKWVQEYSNSLYSWAYFKTSSKESAEDLVQETFISGYKSFDKFEYRSQPKTWLMSILNNKIIDFYRLNSRHNFVYTEDNGIQLSDDMFKKNIFWNDDTILDFWNIDDQEDNSDLLVKRLKNSLNKLPPKWNLAVSYKYFEKKSAKEICNELDISVTNYWQIIHRSKLLLKKDLEVIPNTNIK
jgi:RNA polymerase sigma factor (sigma-70 family)